MEDFMLSAVVVFALGIIFFYRHTRPDLHVSLDLLRKAVSRGVTGETRYFLVLDCYHAGATNAQVEGAIAAGESIAERVSVHVHAR